MLSARHESGGKSGKNNNKSRRDGCNFAFLDVPLILSAFRIPHFSDRAFPH
jgi:hypothetical protein